MKQECEILILTTLDPDLCCNLQEQKLVNAIKVSMDTIIREYLDETGETEEVMIEAGEPL